MFYVVQEFLWSLFSESTGDIKAGCVNTWLVTCLYYHVEASRHVEGEEEPLEERLCGFAVLTRNLQSLSTCCLVRLSRQPSVLFQSSTFWIKPVYLVFSPISWCLWWPSSEERLVLGSSCLVDCLQRNRDPVRLQRNSLIKFVSQDVQAAQWEEGRPTKSMEHWKDESSGFSHYETEMYGFFSSPQPLFRDLDRFSLDQTGSHLWDENLQ